MKTTFIYQECGKDAMYKTWHELGNHIMFLYVNNGDGNIVEHEKMYPLKQGALYFVGTNKSHYTMPDNPAIYKRTKLFIPLNKFTNILHFCDRDQFKTLFTNDRLIYAQIPTSEQSKLDNLFSDLHSYQNDEVYYELILFSVCLRLMMYTDQYIAQTPSSSSSQNFVFNAVKYINDNIGQSLALQELSDAVFVSKYYFCRKFKTTMGLSVMEYILNTRLSLAQEMLLNSKATISDISDQCGFSSVAYFCNIFKRRNGKTPLEYRKSTRI